MGVRAVKSVRQRYNPPRKVLDLLEAFRRLVNRSIEIGLKENVTSLKALSLRSYRHLPKEILAYYRLCAISSAAGMLRNYRKAERKNLKARKPRVRRAFLTTCYGFKVEDGTLKLPIKPRKHLRIPLNRHTLEVLSDPGLDARSVTLTARALTISFSKEVEETEPTGYLGVDVNLENVSTVSTSGSIRVYDVSKAPKIKEVYREVKSHFRRNDVRIRRRIYGKYGRKQRNKVNQMFHRVSKRIVQEAKEKQLGIVLEKLKGIRKLYRRWNGQGRKYRAKMNSWSFYELQRQIGYKARWEGVKVVYVSARGTSKACSICGSETRMGTDRSLWCPSCRVSIDRDVNAARNLAARGLWFGPVASPTEAMVAEPLSKGNPQSRWRGVG